LKRLCTGRENRCEYIILKIHAYISRHLVSKQLFKYFSYFLINFCVLFSLSLIVTFLLPLTLILFNFTVGGYPNDLKLGVVNDECQAVNFNQVIGVNKSCELLKELISNDLGLISFESFPEAHESARRLKVRGVLLFPTNSSQLIAKWIKKGKNSFVDVYLDKSDLHISQFMTFAITNSTNTFLRNSIKSARKSKNYATALSFETIHGKFPGDYKRDVLSGLWISYVFYYG
jgi:hypothetical protein